MKSKKVLTWLLSVACLGALGFGAACGGDNGLSSSVEQSSVVESSSETEQSSVVESSSETEQSSEGVVSSEEVESSEEIISSSEVNISEEIEISSDEDESGIIGASSAEPDYSDEEESSLEESSEEPESSEETENSESEEISSEGHEHYWVVDEIIDPTCTKEGYTVHVCNGCGDSYKDHYQDPVACDYKSLQYDDIQHWYECKWCNDVQTGSLEDHYGGTATTTEKAKCSLCGQSYGEFATPVEPTPTDPVLPGPTTYEKLADGTVNFGAYPQSKVTDSALTTALTAAAGALPTADNDQNWTSYKYYIEGSNAVDYMWYQDVVYGGNTYRGVYFTQYRPYFTDWLGSANYSAQDDNGYYTDNVYWFAYETLNWTVLEEKNGEMFLLCNSIIDSQEYYDNYNNREISGATVYANNYAESNIRKWLNDTFYETAFTSLQQSLIKTTEVDNSAKSTMPYGVTWNDGVNEYACANTNDKIFLLSEEEVTNPNYGFSSNPEDCGTISARMRMPSDYAQSQGCEKSESASCLGNAFWWLRSPSDCDNENVYGISDDGFAYNGDDCVDDTELGVVPALKLTIQ